MTTNELREQLERFKRLRFLEGIADFTNWEKYYEYTAKIKELEKELEKSS